MAKGHPQGLNRVGECLYCHHAGTYYALVKVGGKQIKRSLKTDDLALAKRRLREFRTSASKLTGTEKTLTFEGLSKQWLASIRPHLKDSSYRRRVTSLKQVAPYFKGRPIKNIGYREFEHWRAARAVDLSARTYNIEIETLRLVFEFAREDLRLILDNPAAKLKRRKEDKHQPDIPTKAQFIQLLAEMRNNLENTQSANFIEFLGYSGLRLSEGTSLRWSDINFGKNTLAITGGEQGTKNHEFRVIPLFPALARLLKSLHEANPQVLINTRIFPLESAKKSLASACKRSGLPHWGHHAMRHFFCSNAIETGIDFKVIAEWLGHKDGGILVAKTYGHLRAEHSAAMAQKMTFDIRIA